MLRRSQAYSISGCTNRRLVLRKGVTSNNDMSRRTCYQGEHYDIEYDHTVFVVLLSALILFDKLSFVHWVAHIELMPVRVVIGSGVLCGVA